MRCLDCGYILYGLPENRCPECGRAFDPDNPESYDCGRRFGGKPLVLALIGASGSAAGFAGILGLPSSWRIPGAVEVSVCCIVAGWLIAAHSLSVCIADLRVAHHPKRGVVVVAALINAAALCPLFLFLGWLVLSWLLDR